MAKQETINKQLTALAFQETKPFCYLCYIEAPTGRCDNCDSDDLMRLLDGVGCEYGTEWVIEDILKEQLEPVNKEKVFEDMMEECYPIDTKVAWLEINTIDTLKAMYPLDWKMACDDYIYNLEQDEELMSFDGGSNYFWTSDIENLIEEKLQKEAS